MSQQIATSNTSRTWTFFEGAWHEGNVAIMGPRTQGAWLASGIFDGGRAFEGVTPDLDLHCKRVNNSARLFKLKPVVSDEEWLALSLEGVKKFDGKTALYVRPMYWADAGVGGGVMFTQDSTRWCLCIYEAPMPEPKGIVHHALALSPPDGGNRARRRQGRMPLSEQWSCVDGGCGARLRQLSAA